MKTIFVGFLATILVTSLKICKQQEFDDFKVRYSKTYANVGEEQLRFKIFKANLKIIENHNKRYNAKEESNLLAVNAFADMTSEEFSRCMSASIVPPNFLEKHKRQTQSKMAVPAEWKPSRLDLRVAAIPIKNQGTCEGCWAYGATGIFEYHLFKKLGKYIDLSERMCIDCAAPVPFTGCSGVWSGHCLNYFLANGANYENCYESVDGECAYQSITHNINGVSNASARPFHSIPADENLLAYIILKKGWVIVGINPDTWQLHSKGVIAAKGCLLQPKHTMIAVGYGYDNKSKKNFWILRNSWGTDKGEKGYYRIERGANACGINNANEGYRIYLD